MLFTGIVSLLTAWIVSELLSRAADPWQVGKLDFLFLSSLPVAMEGRQPHGALPRTLRSHAGEQSACPSQACCHQSPVGGRKGKKEKKKN